MSKKRNTFISSDIVNLYTDDDINKVNSMIDNYKKNSELELEISFQNINYSNYIRICEHYVNQTKEDDISSTNSLDISIMLKDSNVYRTSIHGIDNIENFLKSYSQSSIDEIQKYLLGLEHGKDIEIIFKNRGDVTKVYNSDINTLIKNTSEKIVKKTSEKPILMGIEKMLYRYKQRFSFIINDNVRVDLTDVQESKNIWNVTTVPSNYEMELEVINQNITPDILWSELETALRIVQDTTIPIGKIESQAVIEKYKQLLNLTYGNYLDSRNVVSMEAQHIVKFIPNKYAITDKADGERYFLFSNNEGVYLMSINLNIKKIGPSIKDKMWHDMLLDGELIINNNKKMYMVFDVVYFNKIDYRFNNEYILTHRLIIIDKIIDKCFNNLIPFVDYTTKNKDLELNKIKIFYTKELKNYWTLFKSELEKNKNEYFITKKLYFVPYGIDSSEIFMYADLIWKLYVYGKLPPYTLDGIIYTPINSTYFIPMKFDQLDTMPMEYKWKSPNLNSIDFYITFDKDNEGNDAIFFDKIKDSNNNSYRNSYKVCNLYVGIINNNVETPIPFKINGIEQKAYLYLDNDEARDSNGYAINDKTVVEFVFDISKPDIDNSLKWTPIRTRYDKTEAVHKYKSKYGNNINIAIRIWKSIINPVTENNIASLADPNIFPMEIERLSKSINAYKKPTNVYYQKMTSNASGMRSFNNWIKENMILTYCRNKKNILDIGCGRGGDLKKFINANVGEYVGVDIDNNNLYVIQDSAYKRYVNMRKYDSKTPPMHFINADARALFTTKSQENVIKNMSENNKKLIDTFLSGNKKYDAISCQFSLHYYLSDPLSWSNFCKNINEHLEINGYFLVTCFDGKIIYDKMLGKNKMNVSYTDNNGKKVTFFEIVKSYVDNDIQDVGMAIDFYNSLISNPGIYNREYLVFPTFLEESLLKNCNLELVETDTFYNLFNLYKKYFTNNIEGFTSHDNISQKRYQEIRKFYEQLTPNHHDLVTTDMAMASFKLSMLNRYYIFKKAGNIDLQNPSRIVGMNHKINLGRVLEPYFITNNMIIEPDIKNKQINKIYHSIRKPLKNNIDVYLIRHTILVDEMSKRNKLEFVQVKQNNDNNANKKVLLIYKSPEKYFYPIKYKDDNKETYLLDYDKITTDLKLLVKLSEQM